MHFNYPYNSSEVRNLDWIIKLVEELKTKVDYVMSDHIEEAIDSYFNSVMINAIYNEDDEEITLKKEIIVSDDVHRYDAETDSMIIGG